MNGNNEDYEISFGKDNKRIVIFFLGCNFKKLLYLDNFIITKLPTKENTIIVRKKENEVSKDKFKKNMCLLIISK